MTYLFNQTKHEQELETKTMDRGFGSRLIDDRKLRKYEKLFECSLKSTKALQHAVLVLKNAKRKYK